MMTDPIADMLTRIRNAASARKAAVEVPYSRIKWEIAKILEREGFLVNVSDQIPKPRPHFTAAIRFDGRTSAVNAVRRISTPGQRVYAGWDKIPVVKTGYGVTIVSTPNGVMTGIDAQRRKLGGEILCQIS